MIDKLTAERIMDAAQIVDVVSEFVTLKKKGVNYVGLCPFHDDRTPSFSVSPTRNICKCFTCGEGGSAVHFIMKHEQLSYHEALKYLAKKYNIEVEERELTEEQKNAYNERESLFIINDFARTHFSNTLHEHLEGKTIGLAYLRERGFRDDIIKKFQLGYSLDQRDAFTQAALNGGYKKEYLIKTGLTIEGDNYMVDRFRGRVMFPVHTLSGKVVAFGGRILKKAENTGKYVNSPESEIYHKSRELYGIYFAKQAISKQGFCFLVEGYTDVISMHQAGIENVVASSGTALTHDQIRLIHRFTSNVTVLYDGDSAGIKAALRGIDLLLEDGVNVKVVLLPEGEDPDSFARKHNTSDYIDFIRQNESDFIRFKTQLLLADAGEDPIKRAALITDIVHSISIIPDNIIRSVYIKDCSSLLAVDERILVEAVNKKRLGSADQGSGKMFSPSQQKSLPQTDEIEILPKGGPLDRYELAILYYVVRYGTHHMFQPEEGEELTEEKSKTVLEWIKYDLDRDGLWFQHPIYKQMLDEAMAHFGEDAFDPSVYFLRHPQQEISKIAVFLLEDRYELSKIYMKQYGVNMRREDTPLAEEKQLETAVPRMLTELKGAYISMQMNSLKKQMKEMQKAGDQDETMALMQQIDQLGKIKKILAKALGERIILKW